MKGGTYMPDKSLSLLKNYDIEPLQIKKGRGGYIVETSNQTYLFQEFSGNQKKLEILDLFQTELSKTQPCDQVIRTKENELTQTDPYDTTFLLKKIITGKECNYKDENDIKLAFQEMGIFQNKLHSIYEDFLKNNTEKILSYDFPVFQIQITITKHTTECKRIQKYLIKKKNKTILERNLLSASNLFLPQAQEITQQVNSMNDLYEKKIIQNHSFYHGDYQYHNVIIHNNIATPINMEHFGLGSGIKDFCMLFRKICEKNNWNISQGYFMLNEYMKYHPLQDWEYQQLIYMIAYPMKYWKIINHYYNHHKTNISMKMEEKLSLILYQEEKKQEFLNTLFSYKI